MTFREMPAGAATLMPMATAAAQELSIKTLTIVAGFAPGGAADHAARVVAKRLGESIGRSVVIDNQAGAGGNLADQAAALSRCIDSGSNTWARVIAERRTTAQ